MLCFETHLKGEAGKLEGSAQTGFEVEGCGAAPGPHRCALRRFFSPGGWAHRTVPVVPGLMLAILT